MRIPHAVTRPLRTDDRLADVEGLQEVVNDQLFDLFGESVRALFEGFEDLAAEDSTFWYRLFSGIRPESSELLPDLTRSAPFRTLLDFRPRKVSPDVTAAFRSKAENTAIDDVLFKLQDKLLRQLLRLMVPSHSFVNLPDATEEYEDFPADIKQEISLSRKLLRGFALYTLALHSDIVHRRKMCSFTALGLSEHEASGIKSVLDEHEMALLKPWSSEGRRRRCWLGPLSKGHSIRVASGRAAAAAIAAPIVAILASRTALLLGSRENRAHLVVVRKPSTRV